MSPGVLELADDVAFWTDPWTTEDRVREQLRAAGFRGLLLDGPACVPLAERETLPLAGWYGLDGPDLAAGGLRTHGALVAACLETGQVLVNQAFPSKAMTPRPRPPLSPADVEALRASSRLAGFGLDARAVLDLPWTPGTWAFRVLLREHASDAVRVRLEGPPPAAAPGGPAAPWPPAKPGVATYEDVADAPPVPARAGVALAADRVLVPGEAGARWGVKLSYRLPVRPRERVQVEGERLKAVVPITVVVVGSATQGPWALPLRAACYDLVGDEATGSLELDLLKLGRPDPQTFFIYAAAGELWSGPVRSALVSQDALPRDRRST